MWGAHLAVLASTHTIDTIFPRLRWPSCQLGRDSLLCHSLGHGLSCTINLGGNGAPARGTPLSSGEGMLG